MSLSVGDPAPSFTLPSTGGLDVSLSDFLGKPLVIVFYPGDDTPVCTKQLDSYNDDLSQFEALNAQVIALTPAQSVESHTKFAEKHGFGLRCWPTRTSRWRRPTARWACSGSLAEACSSSC